MPNAINSTPVYTSYQNLLADSGEVVTSYMWNTLVATLGEQGNATTDILVEAINILNSVYSGENGTGDMTKAIYDSDNDGVVDAADKLVDGDTNYFPSDFAETSHEHNADDITEGILEVARGGTGVGSIAALKEAINVGAIAEYDLLPVTKGGTGVTTLPALRNAIGLGNSVSTLAIANGGTGATTAPAVRTNMGFTYGTAAPSGVPATGIGSVYFKIV